MPLTKIEIGSPKEAVYPKVKFEVYHFLDSHNHSRQARRFHVFMICLIVLNVLAVIIDTVPAVEAEFGSALYGFEVFSVAVFTVEYVLRLWASGISPEYRGVTGLLRYIISPMALIDLATVLPFYLPLLIPMDLRVLRMIRLFRVFRIFKLGRYSEAYSLLVSVVRSQGEHLLMSVVFLCSLLITSSTVMFYIEHEAQPEHFSSIPSTMWWALVTLTTVGYGDVYPVTTMGKVVSGISAVLGIGLFALPAGILASGFSAEMVRVKACAQKCPHCGKELK